MFLRTEVLEEKKLLGVSMQMSFATNKTAELWKSFMPIIKNSKHAGHTDLYSVEVYNDTTFFSNFDPNKTFEKWAAIAATDLTHIPEGLQTLVLPTGLYAIFMHKGPASDGHKTYNYIFNTWLPTSEYVLGNRPHFALMGLKYKNNDADSEEEIWIPIHKQ